MFIKRIEIKNFRNYQEFDFNNFAIPDYKNVGSGLTIFAGENGCGKTNLLDAIALSLLEYKSETFDIDDLNAIEKDCEISVLSNKDFEVKDIIGQKTFCGSGFYFKGKIKEKSVKKYLSKITTYNREYIPKIKEDKDYNPKLSVNVNNPFSQTSRYDALDVLYLDKNRFYQTKSGTFNKTRFDRLMDDFNFQLINSKTEEKDANDIINKAIEEIEADKKSKKKIENNFLAEAVEKFKQISNHQIKLNFLNNLKPFSSAFFASKTENNIQLELDKIGSGYESIFSLLYSCYLAKQSEKNLIILIDEPELHLHPKLQDEFIKILFEFSKESQIILTTHSPIFVKQALCNQNVKINVVKKDKNPDEIHKEEFLLNEDDYISANEVNFVAFDLATEEYHNDLYELLMCKTGNKDKSIQSFDTNFFQAKKQEANYHTEKEGNNKKHSIHTNIRHQIHHKFTGKFYKNDQKFLYSYQDLETSIKFMRQTLKSLEHKDASENEIPF